MGLIMKTSVLCCVIVSTLLPGMLGNNAVRAQNNERWFQVEMSVFTNENPADREAEYWTPFKQPLSYPGAMQRLDDPLDLLTTDDLLLQDEFLSSATRDFGAPAVQTVEDYILSTGPFPAELENDFKFLDFARDPLVRLPASASNLQETNRTLEQSTDHRLLYTATWRQPARGGSDAVQLYIRGGQVYGGSPELQGSVTIRFDASVDKATLVADLWLAEYGLVADDAETWELPAVPPRIQREYERSSGNENLDYRIRRIYQLNQRRDINSGEFHYLDHPAFGVVIMVNPYAVPSIEPVIDPLLEPETAETLPQQ